jgi:hypothetical protein
MSFNPLVVVPEGWNSIASAGTLDARRSPEQGNRASVEALGTPTDSSWPARSVPSRGLRGGEDAGGDVG